MLLLQFTFCVIMVPQCGEMRQATLFLLFSAFQGSNVNDNLTATFYSLKPVWDWDWEFWIQFEMEKAFLQGFALNNNKPFNILKD